MKQVTLNQEEEVLIPRLLVADTFFSRFMGLMGRKRIAQDEALCFPRCNSIHSFFMRFAIDVIFLNKEGCVVKLVENFKPWRLLLPDLKTKHIVELRAWRIKELGIEVGNKLQCEGVFG